MADLADVESTLASLIAQAVYPTGTGNPSALGVDTRIYRGWPVEDQLLADLTAGKLNVSIYPAAWEQNVTRHPREYETVASPEPTLAAAIAGDTVTFAGALTLPLNVAVLADGKCWTYAVQSGDTLTSVATALASLISVDRAATSSAETLTLPDAASFVVRVGTSGSIMRELKRQNREFHITLWCPTYQLRDAAASLIDPALATYSHIALPDLSHGRIIYAHSTTSDEYTPNRLYRRDLFYRVEYPTTDTQLAYQIIAIRENIETFDGATTIEAVFPEDFIAPLEPAQSWEAVEW